LKEKPMDLLLNPEGLTSIVENNRNEAYTNLTDVTIDHLLSILIEHDISECIRILEQYPVLELAQYSHSRTKGNRPIRDMMISRLIFTFGQMNDLLLPALQRLEYSQGVLYIIYNSSTITGKYPINIFDATQLHFVSHLVKTNQYENVIALLNSASYKALGLKFYITIYCLVLETLILKPNPFTKRIEVIDGYTSRKFPVSVNQLRYNVSIFENGSSCFSEFVDRSTLVRRTFPRHDSSMSFNFQLPGVKCETGEFIYFSLPLPKENNQITNLSILKNDFELEVDLYTIWDTQYDFSWSGGEHLNAIIYRSLKRYPPNIFHFKHKFLLSNPTRLNVQSGKTMAITQVFSNVMCARKLRVVSVSVTFQLGTKPNEPSTIKTITIGFENNIISRLIKDIEWDDASRFSNHLKFFDGWAFLFTLDELENGLTQDFIGSNINTYYAFKMSNGLDALIPESETILVPLIIGEKVLCKHRFSTEAWKKLAKERNHENICPECCK